MRGVGVVRVVRGEQVERVVGVGDIVTVVAEQVSSSWCAAKASSLSPTTDPR